MMLEELGKMRRPVLLKRGLAATIEETLSAAEYLLKGGNRDVMLCERGIRTFETYTRNTLDLAAVAALKMLTHLPIIVDPSHATGRRDLVAPMSRAAVTAGADGLMVEVHPDPERAKCDGPQSLTPEDFSALMAGVRPLRRARGQASRSRERVSTPGGFARIAIVGVGLIGGSIAAALRRLTERPSVVRHGHGCRDARLRGRSMESSMTGALAAKRCSA